MSIVVFFDPSHSVILSGSLVVYCLPQRLIQGKTFKISLKLNGLDCLEKDLNNS